MEQNCSNISCLPLEPDPHYVYVRETARFWVKTVLIPLITLVGVAGNGVTMIVLTRKKMRSSTNHYLTALAASDLFYLVFLFTLSLDHYSWTRNLTYYTFWRYAVTLLDGCSNTSVWLTVTFTIERYIAVCHPIRGKVICTKERAKKVIIFVFIFSFVFVLPTPFEWTVVEHVDPKTNDTKVSIGLSELGQDKTYKTVYYWLVSVIFIFLPLSLLTIFNSFLIQSVHESKIQRRRMTISGDNKKDSVAQESKITIMLISVVVSFMLCQVPTSIILVYTSFNTAPPNSNEGYLLAALGNICNLLMSINAACNFVLYCAFSKKYRRTFLCTFLPCCYRLPSPMHSTNCYNLGFTQVDYDSSPSIQRGRSSIRSWNSRGGSFRNSTQKWNKSPSGHSVSSARSNTSINRRSSLQVPAGSNSSDRKDSCDTSSYSVSTSVGDRNEQGGFFSDCFAKIPLRLWSRENSRRYHSNSNSSQMMKQHIIVTGPEGDVTYNENLTCL